MSLPRRRILACADTAILDLMSRDGLIAHINSLNAAMITRNQTIAEQSHRIVQLEEQIERLQVDLANKNNQVTPTEQDNFELTNKIWHLENQLKSYQSYAKQISEIAKTFGIAIPDKDPNDGNVQRPKRSINIS